MGKFKSLAAKRKQRKRQKERRKHIRLTLTELGCRGAESSHAVAPLPTVLKDIKELSEHINHEPKVQKDVNSDDIAPDRDQDVTLTTLTESATTGTLNDSVPSPSEPQLPPGPSIYTPGVVCYGGIREEDQSKDKIHKIASS